ncbi:hypothetical protein LBMAG57_20810 [Verrucomicrobiota bacterium]|nr:hypothetical protein LBMAG57_20810 [Verrucomicrobiota bacterium]
MAGEVFWDTSGFFALLNTDDLQHTAAKALAEPAVTTDGIIGECCTLLIARKKPHLVPRFLDFTEQPGALRVVHLDELAIAETKAFLRRHLDHAYSFVDCSSFIVMTSLGIRDAATTDAHFTEAGFTALLR